MSQAYSDPKREDEPTAATAAPYAILDESGKVRSWIESGRKVRVWVSHDIGAGRPDMLTPGDVETPPHWAYPVAASTVYDAGEVVFFRKSQVVADWTDSPAGWKAAERYLDAHPDESRDAPVGKVLTTYSRERITLESTAKVHHPGTQARGPIPGTTAYDLPLMTRYRVAVVAWVAILPTDEALADAREGTED